MLNRVIEIAEDGRYLSVERGFLKVSTKTEELGRVPLDDIATLIVTARDASLSKNVMLALAERGGCTVLCGDSFHPVAMVTPLDGHHRQTARIQAQTTATKPLQKQLWKTVVAAKIRAQREVLNHLHPLTGTIVAGRLERLAQDVKSGDPENHEGQAARLYWPTLLGADFRRDVKAGGLNALLNYGYAVLRAAVARAVVAAGLHPSLGIHHHNQYNSFALVDDMMEPFRVLVDAQVFALCAAGVPDMDRETKAALAGILESELPLRQGRGRLVPILNTLAANLAESFVVGKPQLELPTSFIRLPEREFVMDE